MSGRDDGALAYEDDEIVIATDFEGGNGTDIRRFRTDEFGLVLESDPGDHRFAGVGYYVCFGRREQAAFATVHPRTLARPRAQRRELA